MYKILWTTIALLTFHSVQSYILLTANIEDVQNVAKRMVQSPITGHVGNIMRRAYGAFSNHLSRARAPSGYDSDIVLGFRPGEHDYRRKGNDTISEDISAQPENENMGKSKEKEEPSLGKSASAYLKKIQKIFESS